MESETSITAFAVPVHVGTMGWGYTDWVGSFYPTGVASKEYIELYARVFDTVEIDSTFYGTPKEAQVKNWRDITPEQFRFCPKIPRVITHEMRLVGAEEATRHFVKTMKLLGSRRGPMLFQFPPDFTRAELSALEAFLPKLKELADPEARFAVEFRHRSLIAPDVSELLTAHNVALASVDYVSMPRRFELTSDFVYVRLIGQHGAFNHHAEMQKDRFDDLRRWAGVLRKGQERYSEAFVFCNNEYEGHGRLTANRFKQLIGQPTKERPPEAQGTLF